MSSRSASNRSIDFSDSQTGVWNFDNSYARLPDSFFQRVAPTPVTKPEMVVFNDELADDLGLKPDGRDGFAMASELSGNEVPDDADPIAQAYAGHQFGGFTMLGDGRAILLGEQITADERRFDIQLKGSGRTRYSRSGDGRAALGPMLREYLISEALHALGIPTTRSLAVVSTGEAVYRERPLPGAILTRVAASHIRVGTFQYFAGRQDHDGLKALADYTIDRHYPESAEQNDRYLAFFKAVAFRQADLIASWMLVGFVHGVMNTDNVSICGETIDYGPCAFMDRYDLDTVFSSIDLQGRYAYGNQPIIGQWNLGRFAETLLTLIDDDSQQAIESATEVLKDYEHRYQHSWMTGMRQKLGIPDADPDDETLIESLSNWMAENDADMTNTFRALSDDDTRAEQIDASEGFQNWHRLWRDRVTRNGRPLRQVRAAMRRHNPAVIPRNHLVESALQSAEGGDLTQFETLLRVLSDPYSDQDRDEKFTAAPPVDAPAYRTFCGT